MSSIVAEIVGFVRDLVLVLGYPGIFLAMFVEGIITPIPSEAILPLAGSLAYERPAEFSVWAIIIVATVGATLGSTVAYFIGHYFGRGFVHRYGKYFRIGEEHLVRAERWFEKYGRVSIFIGHSLPGTRSFISFPAGIARMNLRSFVISTFFGALIWNTVLTLTGYFLSSQLDTLEGFFEYLDIIALITALALIAIYFYWRKKQRAQA
ncbi:MAG: DedA family protein [Thermoplasmata archaeon]